MCGPRATGVAHDVAGLETVVLGLHRHHHGVQHDEKCEGHLEVDTADTSRHLSLAPKRVGKKRVMRKSAL